MATAVVGVEGVRIVRVWLRWTWRDSACRFSAGAIVAIVVSSSSIAVV